MPTKLTDIQKHSYERDCRDRRSNLPSYLSAHRIAEPVAPKVEEDIWDEPPVEISELDIYAAKLGITTRVGEWKGKREQLLLLQQQLLQIQKGVASTIRRVRAFTQEEAVLLEMETLEKQLRKRLDKLQNAIAHYEHCLIYCGEVE